MKLITVVLVFIIGLACCAVAAPSTNHQFFTTCKTTLDWLRMDENALDYMRNDEDVSTEFMELLESNVASENICDLLMIRETDDQFRSSKARNMAKSAAKGARIGQEVGRFVKEIWNNHRHQDDAEQEFSI